MPSRDRSGGLMFLFALHGCILFSAIQYKVYESAPTLLVILLGIATGLIAGAVSIRRLKNRESLLMSIFAFIGGLTSLGLRDYAFIDKQITIAAPLVGVLVGGLLGIFVARYGKSAAR
jgi:hypothetical protein